MMKLRWWRADASEVMAVTAMGVWEAVLAGGGRRFIKRKDSDAGETGFVRSHLRRRRPHRPPLVFRILQIQFRGFGGFVGFGTRGKAEFFLLWFGSSRLVFVPIRSRSFFSAFEEIF
jgi:hypothetical protein